MSQHTVSKIVATAPKNVWSALADVVPGSADLPLFCRVAMPGKVVVRGVAIHCQDAQSLIASLDEELLGEYAAEHWHPVDFEPFHREGGVFVVAYEAETPVACGALRPIDETQVELKRMFVIESYRGRGVSRHVLEFLEDMARELGFKQVVLETGDQQQAAIGLYSNSGYQRVPAFGEYVHSPRSICFAKNIGRESG